MAVIAILGSGTMSSRFAGCYTTIMTGLAASDFVVVHVDACPGIGARYMTGTAIVCRSSVIGGFSWRSTIIVTGHTGTNHFIVINIARRNWYPGRGTWLMARVAPVCGVDMTATLATCNITIVTTCTTAIDLTMVNGR